MSKKILAILLTLCICLSVVGCSGSSTTADYDTDLGFGYGSTESCNHSFEPATCEEPQTCILCGEQNGQALGHSYGDWKTVRQATYESYGKRERSCYLCDKTESESIAKLAHPPVEYISQRRIQDNDNKGYTFLFCFLDENKKEISAPATVKMRIVNSAGKTVYTGTKQVTMSDFSTWTTNSTGESHLKAAVYINFSEMTKGTSDNGTFYYQITADDGASFSEESFSVDGLPTTSSGSTSKWNLTQAIKLHEYAESAKTYSRKEFDASWDDSYLNAAMYLSSASVDIALSISMIKKNGDITLEGGESLLENFEDLYATLEQLDYSKISSSNISQYKDKIHEISMEVSTASIVLCTKTLWVKTVYAIAN